MFVFFSLSISTDGSGEFEKQGRSFGLTDSMKGVTLLGDSVFCLSYDVKVSGIMAYVEVEKVPPFVTRQAKLEYTMYLILLGIFELDANLGPSCIHACVFFCSCSRW